MKKFISTVFLLILFPVNALGLEVLDICATYLNTGKSYKVEGQIYKGTELNQATKTWDYDSWATYVVIFWAKGQASIIELDYYFGDIASFGNNGSDQRGYRWEIKKGHSWCW